MNHHIHAQAIASQMDQARAQLAALDLELQRYTPVDTLEAARALPDTQIPIWPAAPSRAALEARDGGDANYLYLYWPVGPDGRYLGPVGRTGRPRSKTYIGADRAAQQLARAMIDHRDTYTRIAAIRNHLYCWLTACERALQATHTEAARYLAALAHDLQTLGLSPTPPLPSPFQGDLSNQLPSPSEGDSSPGAMGGAAGPGVRVES